ncbi:MAG: cyclic nucleotide-binding domain-containing protein [Candidatus Acidiferrales bacterium]
MLHRENRPFDLQALLTKVGLPRTVVEYRKGQSIFSQGDPAKTVFYIQKGGVKLAVISDRGKEAVIAILGAGSFFGEGCLAGQRAHGDRDRDRTQHHAQNWTEGNDARHPRPASVFRPFHATGAFTQHSSRSGFGGSTLQLE